jgi:hypothetical protein
MAIFGWSSALQAATYTKNANRTRLAADAMHLLVPDENGSGRKGVPPRAGECVPPERQALTIKNLGWVVVPRDGLAKRQKFKTLACSGTIAIAAV